MPALSPEAVSILWPVIQIFGAIVSLLIAMAGMMWAGFRWLDKRIMRTSAALLVPVRLRLEQHEKDLARIEQAVNAAHRRIDSWTGSTGSGSWRLKQQGDNP